MIMCLGSRIIPVNLVFITKKLDSWCFSRQNIPMKKLLFEINCKKTLAIVIVTFFGLCLCPAAPRAEAQSGLTGCAAIEDSALRLQCYDEMAGRQNALSAASGEDVVQNEDLSTFSEPAKPSYMSRLWELDENRARNKLAIKMHRSNYILPYSYNFSPNEEPFEDEVPERDILGSEVAFQLSIKTKIWQDLLFKNVDLWFGYTQRSFWQFYNFQDSAPFRETNYEPEVLVNVPVNLNMLGLINLRTVNLGFNHQSNGNSEPLSRSWNRIVANFGFERENVFSDGDTLVLELKSWYRLPESEGSDDNPEIEDYMGDGEFWLYYLKEKHRFGMMVRNNLDSDDMRGALQLEWSFPLSDRVSGYIQGFTGYGESLLDYDHRANRVGVGFILTDWD